MFRFRQSSPWGAISVELYGRLRAVLTLFGSGGTAGQERPNVVALMVVGPRGGGMGEGAWKRRGPVGGRAYGIPRYSWTWGFRRAGWPRMVVLLGVSTVGPALGLAVVKLKAGRRRRRMVR